MGMIAGCALVAVAVADEPAGVAQEGCDAGALGQQFGHFAHADVDRDVLAEQHGINAEVDVVGHPVRGVVGDHQDAAEARRSDEAEGFAHRSLPAMRHQSGSSASAAASRAASLS